VVFRQGGFIQLIVNSKTEKALRKYLRFRQFRSCDIKHFCHPKTSWEEVIKLLVWLGAVSVT
jgi:hypothetical protein